MCCSLDDTLSHIIANFLLAEPQGNDSLPDYICGNFVFPECLTSKIPLDAILFKINTNENVILTSLINLFSFFTGKSFYLIEQQSMASFILVHGYVNVISKFLFNKDLAG